MLAERHPESMAEPSSLGTVLGEDSPETVAPCGQAYPAKEYDQTEQHFISLLQFPHEGREFPLRLTGARQDTGIARRCYLPPQGQSK